MLRHRCMIDVFCERRRGERPHRKEGKPTKKLHHTEFPHDARHVFEVFDNFDDAIEESFALCILFSESF